MGGGSDPNDSTTSSNVTRGNDARAAQLSLGEFRDDGEELPDFEEFEPEGAETDTGTAGGAADAATTVESAPGDGPTDETGPPVGGEAAADAATTVESGSGDGPTDETGPPVGGEAAADAATTVESGSGDGPTGVDPGGVDAIPTGDGEGGAFTAAELREETTVRAFAEWVNEHTRATLTDEDVAQIQRLAADDLGADVPAAVDLDDATEYEPMVFADDTSGASEASMWVARTPDGRETYVTLASRSAAGDPVESGAVVGEVSAAFAESETSVAAPAFPAVGVDQQREAVVLESVGAADSTAVSRYRASGEGHEKADYAAAIGGKLIVGDTDLGGNVVTSSDGGFHPIDFDLAGGDLAAKDERIAEDDGVLNGEYDGLWDKVTSKANARTRNFAFEYEDGEIRDHVRSLAGEVDVDALDRRLSEHPNVSRRSRENVIENVRALREGRL